MPMSEQDVEQATTLRPPTKNDKEAWKAYWKAHGQMWRTEPEIYTERQKYLDKQQNIIPDVEQGIYPFKDVRLSRADVEWLLATHENGLGPIDWSDNSQRDRSGLDLRGADLSKVNLSGLPLARTCWGSIWRRRSNETEEQRRIAGACLEGKLFNKTSKL